MSLSLVATLMVSPDIPQNSGMEYIPVAGKKRRGTKTRCYLIKPASEFSIII